MASGEFAGPIHRLAGSEIPAASAVFARAFQCDPLFCCFLPRAAGRQRRLERLFRSILQYGLHYGELQATSHALEGVAMWLPPGNSYGTIPKMARAGLLFLPLTIGPRCFFRVWRYSERIAGLRRRHILAPHWFLQLLGVDPQRQNQGHATRLLRLMLERLDREKAPCCLDTAKPANLSFYERFGFRVAAEGRGTSDLAYWLMVRDGRQ